MKTFKLKKDWFNGARKRKKGTMITCHDNDYQGFVKGGYVEIQEKNTNDKNK